MELRKRLSELRGLWPERHMIPVTRLMEHRLRFRIRARWWPPFAATEFLAPRYRVEIVNDGEEVDGLEVRVAAAPYEGTFRNLPPAEPAEWRVVVDYRELGRGLRRRRNLGKGKSGVMYVTIPTGQLHAGTWALRLHVVIVTTRGLPRGITARGHATGYAFPMEYLRVEPVSTVLTLAVAVGTLLLAAATTVLALTM